MALKAAALLVLTLTLACCGRPHAPAAGGVNAAAAAGAAPAPAGTACRRTGCSGEVCAEAATMTPCVWRPAYACYRTARCERQPDGRCGFTQDAALVRCLDEARAQGTKALE